MIGYHRVRGVSSPQSALHHARFYNGVTRARNNNRQCPKATIGPELAELLVEAQSALESSSQIGLSIQAAVDSLASTAPEPLQPLISVLGGDVAALALQSPTVPGIARLSVSGGDP